MQEEILNQYEEECVEYMEEDKAFCNKERIKNEKDFVKESEIMRLQKLVLLEELEKVEEKEQELLQRMHLLEKTIKIKEKEIKSKEEEWLQRKEEYKEEEMIEDEDDGSNVSDLYFVAMEEIKRNQKGIERQLSAIGSVHGKEFAGH